jgi:5,10-methenyltetrahydrofolate synthetase
MNYDRSDDRSKNWWRSEMKRRLDQNSADFLRDANLRIGTAVSEITFSRQGLWLAFSSARTEPTLPAIKKNSTSRYAYPRMIADPTSKVAASKMSFHVWEDSLKAPAWSEHRFGIREPDVSQPEWRELGAADQVCGALVPGLGFDRRLRRLGRGAGFYDRFLEDSKFLKVGVGFAVQLTDELPHESHDVELDALVTDREVIWNMGPSSWASRERKVDAS